jgi:hypothetical protein
LRIEDYQLFFIFALYSNVLNQSAIAFLIIVS